MVKLKRWKFKCSFCDARFIPEADCKEHVQKHIDRESYAKVISRGSEFQPDYSEAEYELNRRYGI